LAIGILLPCSNGVAEAHEQQEPDPVEEKGGEESGEEDEVIAQQSRVRGFHVERVVEGGECQESEAFEKKNIFETVL